MGIPPPPRGFAGFVRAGPGARALTDGDMRAAGDIIVPCGAKLLRRSRKASTAASEGNMLWRPVSGRLMVLTLIVSGNALMVPANDWRLLRAVQDASSQQRSTWVCWRYQQLALSRQVPPAVPSKTSVPTLVTRAPLQPWRGCGASSKSRQQRQHQRSASGESPLVPFPSFRRCDLPHALRRPRDQTLFTRLPPLGRGRPIDACRPSRSIPSLTFDIPSIARAGS